MADLGKILLGGLGIVYIISPVDFIPEAIAGPLGVIDDFAIAMFAIPLFLEGLGMEDAAEKAEEVA